MKMIVLGFDGCSYSLINKLKDKLPNFSKLISNKKLGTLISTDPPHTAPGWTSAFTGVNSGKHGIYQFWDTQAYEYIGKFMGSDDLNILPVWEMLNIFGLKTAVVNVPMTYPPKEIDGLMITWPLHNTLRYAYPNNILYEIKNSGGHYLSDLSTMFQGNLEDYISKAMEITKKRLVTLLYIIDKYPYDFYVSVFTEIDRVSHFYWHFMDKESPYYTSCKIEEFELAVERIYIEADKVIGEIMEIMDKETILMVLSDHGFCKGNINFYIQSFLIESSYLVLKEDNSSQTMEKNTGTLFDVKADSWLECNIGDQKYVVDWNKTTAYMAAPGSYGININLKERQSQGIVKKDDYNEVRGQLISKLRNVRHPATNEYLFKDVKCREQVYWGEKTDTAPDIILIPYDYGTMVHHDIKPGIMFGVPEQKGMHDMDGIFSLYGDEVEDEALPEQADIWDITPTILDYFGIEQPKYFDGRTIYNFERKNKKKFKEEDLNKSKLNKPVEYTPDEIDDAKKRLKSLGYL